MFTHDAGESVAVPISLDGRPAPALVWTLNGDVIQSSTRRTLSNTGLTISSVAAEDAGEYVVTASNVVNSTSTSFQLIVRSTSSSLSTLPRIMLSVLLMMCTAVVLY